MSLRPRVLHLGMEVARLFTLLFHRKTSASHSSKDFLSICHVQAALHRQELSKTGNIFLLKEITNLCGTQTLDN